MDRIIAYKCVKGVNTKRGVGEAASLARGVGQGTGQTPGRVGDSCGYGTVEQTRMQVEIEVFESLWFQKEVSFLGPSSLDLHISLQLG